MTKGLQGSLRKKKKSYKLHHDSQTISPFDTGNDFSTVVYFNCKKRRKKPWAFVDVCAAPSVLDVRWQILTWQLGETATLPSHGRGPRGTAEKNAENVSSFRGFQGTGKKNMFNEAPRRFSEQREKNSFSLRSPLPPPGLGEEGGKENRQGGGTHARVQMCFARTEALRACSLRQLLAGYRKVSRCYLEEIKSILPNKLDIAAGGGATRRRRPPKFNSVHLR